MSKIRSILNFVLKAMIALTVLVVVLASIEINRIAHPRRVLPPGNTLRKNNIPYQSVDLITDDGVRLSAWYTHPRNGAVILLAHGYGDNRPEWIQALFAKKGFGVMSWDARAHGESGGEVSTIGYLEVLDVKAALEYVLAQPDVKHVGAWGGSMGAATIIRAAAEFPQIQAVFADSSYTSLDDEINYLVPYPLINPLTKFIATAETGLSLDQVAPLDDIGKISPRPVYIVQGLADTVAPPDTGEKLYNAAHEPRFLWEKENVPHMQMYEDNPRRYQKRMVAFFDEWLLGK
jgi:fermentation-respiration switch protein FrsA (DUF1100 family)